MSFSEQVKRDTPSPKAFIAAINAITPSELTQEQQNLAQGFFTTLYQSGIQATRHYHNWDHYNDVAGDTPSPNRLIAALFHDCVQKNVDSGIEAATETALRHYYTEPEKVPDSITKAHIEEATSLEHLSAERRTLLTLIGTLFDSTEMKPPPNNANEFLSALYCAEAGSQLGIPKANILQQAALIVATVPFLSHDDFNHLEARLHAANSALPEAERLTDEQIVETMREATDMANQDVTNFAGDFETFKANSLKLLKESTQEKNDPRVLSEAIKGMANFMCYLASSGDTTSIFHASHGEPSNEELQHLNDKAQKNIGELIDYLANPSTAIGEMTKAGRIKG